MSDKRNDFGPVRTGKPSSRPYAGRPERVLPNAGKTRRSGDQSTGKPENGTKSGGNKKIYRNFEHKSGGDEARRPFRPTYPKKPFDKKPAERGKMRPGATDGMPARRIALDVIRKVTEEGAWASLALDQKLHGCTLSGADRRFAARLVYDTLDNLIYLDHALRQVMAKPDTDIRLVNILRLGACQLLLDYRVPENAATDTSVRLCRELGLDGLSGVCNGILRNLIRKKDELSWPDPAAEPLRALSVEASVPEWLVKRLLDDWGQADGTDLVRRRARSEGITLRPNLMRLDDAAFEELLKKKVWEREPGRVPHSVKVRGMIDITADTDWQQGLYSIQSEGSQAACLAVDPKPGWRVLDCCAAPGGKACYLDEMMGDAGRVQAWEIHPHRTDLIVSQARRLHLENVRPMTRDASVRREDLDMTFDAVLLDAPCSGTGDMAEKPDIKLRLTERKVEEMVRIQAELLDNVCLAVKPGGVLVYATCSLLRDENDRQVEAFLRRHPDFHLDPLPDSIPDVLRAHAATGLQLMPHRDGIGGFYLCRMRRDRL
ncbi:MAG: 16S rRNA (cytosine(967)-C(5))-methyltransferase RsmB [Clostridia bacterium]|nr:16S rRNA (cytosine(967)-C(5))-methyltransferase RsmB [Clostridia bacterium]